MNKQVAQMVLFVGVMIVGLQLLMDPWAKERFQRAIRENARIENRLLDFEVPERTDQIREVVGVLTILAGIGMIFDVYFLNRFLMLLVALFGFLYANPMMLLYAEKFNPLYVGVLSTCLFVHLYSLGKMEEKKCPVSKQ